ncbi:im:7160594_2 [Blepharisma stoltei]|uniref:Lysosomal dipeptide transporter MFSD1 n=1 Tax=Blepharisma stoltei TaxID=1481888 RepID=A0AAU9JTU6_9CILI|nr:unnamed protein product [Blepharisma stoltei]
MDNERLIDESDSSIPEPAKQLGSIKVEEPPTNDMAKTKSRYLMLFFACFLCFGNYYIYDNPSALQPQLEKRLNMNSFEFNMLYSVYSFPNVILPLFGGYFIDAIGVRWGIIIFSGFICLGQAIFAIGVDAGSYPIAVIGRCVFGLGGESQNVAQSTIVSAWFSGKELAMALGMNVSISRLGSVFNDLTEPAFDSLTGSVDFGIWFGFGLCLASMACGFALIAMDKKRDIKLGVLDKKIESDKVKWSDLKTFNFSFWLISINCLVVYICVLCFNNIASDYFQTRFGFSSVIAGVLISITYSISAVLCPIIGFYIDRVGNRATLITISAVIMVIVHTIFIIIPDCDQCAWGALDLVLLGLGYSLYASVMWASVPLVVEPKTVGSAFGIVTAIQNFGLAFGPMVVGAIHDNSSGEDGYLWVSFFFIIMGILGVITAIILQINDKKTGGVLNSSNPKEALKLMLTTKKATIVSDQSLHEHLDTVDKEKNGLNNDEKSSS